MAWLKSISGSSYEKIAWFVVLLILFGQSILGSISIISNFALAYIALRHYYIGNIRRENYNFVFAILFVLCTYSIAMGNSLALAIRFSLIIFFILFSYTWEINYRYFLKCLILISSILILALICLEIFLFIGTDVEYQAIRQFVTSQNMGDVFFYHVYYKLELRGNALLVFIYMLSYVIDIFPSKHKIFFRFYYIVGVILAGNFAYQMAIVLFHLIIWIYEIIRNPAKRFRILLRMGIVFLILGGILLEFVLGTMEEKSDASSAPRIDQAIVLIGDMSRNVVTLLFGSGLGHTVDVVTEYRDYTGKTYFELQTLYFFNQLGLLGFLFFAITNVVLSFRLIKLEKLLLVYCVYLIYAATNPYIWDTNHVVVITSLLCARAQICDIDLQSKMINKA